MSRAGRWCTGARVVLAVVIGLGAVAGVGGAVFERDEYKGHLFLESGEWVSLSCRGDGFEMQAQADNTVVLLCETVRPTEESVETVGPMEEPVETVGPSPAE